MTSLETVRPLVRRVVQAPGSLAARWIREVRFRRSIQPTDIFVVAFPKSGTTWVSFFLALLVAKRMGVEEPTDPFEFHTIVPPINREFFKRLPIPPYPELPRPRVFRVHAPFDASLPRVIYIVRDPRAVVVSLYHYSHRTREDFQASLDAFVRENRIWRTDWGEHVSGWLRHRSKPHVLFTRYEDLHEDPRSQFARIAEFCGYPLSGASLEEHVQKSSFGRMRRLEEDAPVPQEAVRSDIPFMRTGRVDAWREELAPETLALIESRYRQPMIGLGYEPEAIHS